MARPRFEAHGISPGTLYRMQDHTQSDRKTLAVVFCIAAAVILCGVMLARVLPASAGGVVAAGTLVAAFTAAAAAARALLRPRRRACASVLPQVMSELYPDFSFDASAGPDQIRERLPQRVLNLVDGVAAYEGTLCRRTPQGDIRIYAVEARSGSDATGALRQHLVYELRAPLSLASTRGGFVEVSDRRPSCDGSLRDRLAAAAQGLASDIATLLPGEASGFGKAPGSWLHFRSDTPDRAHAVLTASVIQALERYFETCRLHAPALRPGIVVFAENMLYVVVPDATLALEGASWRPPTEASINGNAAMVCRRLEAIAALAAHIDCGPARDAKGVARPTRLVPMSPRDPSPARR
ncbi:hypothetical protein [Collinsella sp. An2]|uniref:hypothetical protein n=1 Tax=Collinsella sp. An2 TaxID=1965585 RepID=UPI000B37CBA8|nr:hypothetical protein [Collinsella sp. An2]OUP08426.1 hypothetical protein B5F33_06910 [Collinsella sp. An2]